MNTAAKRLLEFGPFRIDVAQRLLLRDRQQIQLSPKAFDLLLILANRSGEVLLKDELMTLLWPDTFVEESNLSQHVFQLRKALGEQGQTPSYIITVPGRGYRFGRSVRTLPVETPEETAQIVVESHSRSSLVIEEERVVEGEPASATKLWTVVLVMSIVVATFLLGFGVLRVTASPQIKVLSVRQITHSGRIEPYGKVLSDGSRLYFAERIGGVDALKEVPAGGGEPALIPTSFSSLMAFDIDPSQSRLLVESQSANFNNPVWILSTAGGSAQPLGDVVASQAIAWSPDGERIFYGHSAEIWVVDKDGKNAAKLVTVPGSVTALRVAPDGKRLRYTVREPTAGSTSLWESAVDGANAHPMSLGWKATAAQWGEGECCGEWSPDGKYFLFRTERSGVDTYWAIAEKPPWWSKTNTPIELYSSPDHMSDPRFSPDGKKILFAYYQERRELVRYDSAQKLFVPYLGGIPARLLSFSRDGKWAAYRHEPDGALWRSRVDGGEALQLTFPPMVVYHSSWMPDGSGIVFEGRLPGESPKLYRVPATGGKAEVLISIDASGTGPSCSPDGRFVLFQRWTQDAQDGIRHSGVYILDLRTRETRMIPGSQDFDGVHWSPDGKYAAAANQADHRLMLFDFAQQRWSVLAEGQPYGWGIRWSSDSRYVYYQHLEQGEEQPIFRVGIGDRKAEQITSTRQILRADVLGYSMTGLTLDNSPLASLIHRNSDIYVIELDIP